jgi:hypothetical protein
LALAFLTQVYWTHDTVYFFMDFTLAKAPFVAVGLSLLMVAIFGAACALSMLKWRLLLGRQHTPERTHTHALPTLDAAPSAEPHRRRVRYGRAHPRDPHRADVACCCDRAAAEPHAYDEPDAEPDIGHAVLERDAFGLDHPAVPYLAFSPVAPT